MKRNHAAAAVLLFVASLLLTACGFHLRGSMGEANLPFNSIHITSAFPDHSVLVAELRRAIRSMGNTTVETDRKKAEVTLEILEEKQKKAVLSLNSQGRVREYSLFYLVRFQVRDKNNQLLTMPTAIELRRTLAYNEAQALAKEAEEQMLYRDMRSDLVQQMIRRLAALKIPAASGTPVQATPSAGKS